LGDYEEALQLDPECVGIYVGRAVVKLGMGDGQGPADLHDGLQLHSMKGILSILLSCQKAL